MSRVNSKKTEIFTRCLELQLLENDLDKTERYRQITWQLLQRETPLSLISPCSHHRFSMSAPSCVQVFVLLFFVFFCMCGPSYLFLWNRSVWVEAEVWDWRRRCHTHIAFFSSCHLHISIPFQHKSVSTFRPVVFVVRPRDRLPPSFWLIDLRY